MAFPTRFVVTPLTGLLGLARYAWLTARNPTSRSPFVPTYPTCRSQSLASSVWVFRLQDCVIGGLQFGRSHSKLKSLVGVRGTQIGNCDGSGGAGLNGTWNVDNALFVPV